jgi:hypothetical protein
MEKVKKYIDSRIKRNTEKLEALEKDHGKNPEKTHTYWGGEKYGYLKGRLSAFEDTLDSIEDNPITAYYVETPLINFTMLVAQNIEFGYSCNIRCYFETGGKKHVFEEKIEYRKIGSSSEIEKKEQFLKIVFKRISEQLTVDLLKTYNLEEIKI